MKMNLSLVSSYIFCILTNIVVGKQNRIISALYPTPITPPNWAFLIWVPIFTLQGISIIKKREIPVFLWSNGLILIAVWQFLFTALQFILCIPVLMVATASFYNSAFLTDDTLVKTTSLISAAWLSSATTISLLLPCHDITLVMTLFALAALEIFGLFTSQLAFSLTLAWTFGGVYAIQKRCEISYFAAQAMGFMLINALYLHKSPVEEEDTDEEVQVVLHTSLQSPLSAPFA